MKFFIFILSVFLSLTAYGDEVLSENTTGVILYDANNAEDIQPDTDLLSSTDIEAAQNIKGSGNYWPNARWQTKAQDILLSALSLTGIKYTYGGSTPDTGFDCSGFVRYVFSQATNLTLPHSARAIAQIGKTIKREDLQPGDLVFFNTLKTAFSHVGIYVGDNKFVHAPRTGKLVRVESLSGNYWASRFSGAQRLENEVE